MRVFSVYIPFFISRVRPVHSFFEKKSILENSSQIFTNFFYAYLTPVSFGKWEEDGSPPWPGLPPDPGPNEAQMQ